MPATAAERPRLLFIAPVMPSLEGNGTAMRAGLFLAALAGHFAVTLAVVPVFQPTGGLPPGRLAQACARRIVEVPLAPEPLYDLFSRLKDPAERARALALYPRPALCRHAGEAAVAAVAGLARDGAFAVVHVMRLYLAPFAEPFLAPRDGRPVVTLDLDDDEPRTWQRIAALHGRTGDALAARVAAAEAAKYEALARAALPRFDRVLACSAGDAAAVAAAYGVPRIAVVPNAVALPEPVAAPAGGDDSLLLVGSLSYFPNQDAALFLCREVLPRLEAQLGRRVRLAIVGADPPAAVRALGALPGVTVTGTVPDTAPYYRAADLAVAPLRAGGGTRVKILEAFAHDRAVVATTLGAEGIEATPGEHLLIADDADAFAGGCARLLQDPALRRRIAAAGRRLVATRYALPVVTGEIGTLFAGLSAGRLDPAPGLR
jgi:polysaccharide biosynthesis protein PslH